MGLPIDDLDIKALILRTVEELRLTEKEHAQPDAELELLQSCPQWALATTCKACRDAARDASAWTTLWVPGAERLTPNSIALRIESSPRFERVTTLIFSKGDGFNLGRLPAGAEFYARLAALQSLRALALNSEIFVDTGHIK